MSTRKPIPRKRVQHDDAMQELLAAGFDPKDPRAAERMLTPAKVPGAAISINEFCQLFGISRRTFFRSQKENPVRVVSIGRSQRILPEDVEAYRKARADEADRKAERKKLSAQAKKKIDALLYTLHFEGERERDWLRKMASARQIVLRDPHPKYRLLFVNRKVTNDGLIHMWGDFEESMS